MIKCTVINKFTPEESLARLLAIKPLPVGERLTRWCQGTGSTAGRFWFKLWRKSSTQLSARAHPLRHARERAKTAKQWKMTACKQFGMLHVARDEIANVMVGAAMLEFFTDLSVLVRKTPAPCPWCGETPTKEDSASCHVFCRVMFDWDDSMEERSIREWNRVAIPAAYRRLT